ncbi:hypothetical protein [Paraburkholderia bryophila]|uniref:hypothetical protein n=1 Tax=Paraburkholderia bryophila TaxID=420952 RepID=UPI00142DB597|nr:hypothetical protein [Paraburkholderia bryophila]
MNSLPSRACHRSTTCFRLATVTLCGVLDNGFVYQSSSGSNSAERAVPGGL